MCFTLPKFLDSFL